MHPSGCTALASARAHRVCIFVCNLAWFHPRQLLFLGAVALFPSFSPPSSLSLSFILLTSFPLRLFSRLPSISYIFPPACRVSSLSVLSFAPISHPRRRRVVHGVPLFSLFIFPARPQAPLPLFFSRTHPHSSDPPRLTPFRTFTFAEPYPTLRIIPAAVYRTIYICIYVYT